MTRYHFDDKSEYQIFCSFPGPFSHTYIRSQVVDFSLPVYIDYGTGFFALEIKTDYLILIRAFDWRVWLGFLILTPVFIITVGLSDWFYSGKTHWWSYIDICLRSVFMDSVRIPPGQDYTRIYFLGWILGSFVLSTAYTGIALLVAFHSKVAIIFIGLAALVSLIAKPPEPDLIKSVDELVRQDEISWLIEAGSAFANFGMDAEEGTTLR